MLWAAQTGTMDMAFPSTCIWETKKDTFCKMMDFLKKHKEIILYIIFGVGTTLVNWVIYTLLVTICNSGVTVGNAIAWVAAIIFAFITNKLFVFESKSWAFANTLKEGLSFLASRIFSGIVEIVGPILLIQVGLNQSVFGIKGAVAKAITSIVVIILNYLLSKLLVFRKKETK